MAPYSMVPLKIFCIACIFCQLGQLRAVAQEINVKRIELEHEKVSLVYDLQDTTRGRHYTINVYSSRDNFINPLKNISGDWGLEVPPGNNHKIVFNVKEEFGADFNEKLAFELRGKVYVPFIRLDGFNHFRKFTRLKHYEIHWSGGRPQNVLNLGLYKGEKKVHVFPGIANEGQYSLFFPASTKPGKNYHFRITDSKNKDEIVNTGSFAIRRKVPLIFKLIPAAAAGSLLYILLKPEQDCAGCIADFPPPKN
jgi:hypothetical protein